ncbi:hypothetical protein [Marivirga sp.]|uniref:hypothetical protein n=1 Tax=Marivirga sp. TaxID=2018662 RepID=UPI003DA71015
MPGILIYLIPILFITLLFAIPNTRNFADQFISEILALFGGIGLTVTELNSNDISAFGFGYTWSDAVTFNLIICFGILLVSILISAKRNKHDLSINGLEDKIADLEKDLSNYQEEYFTLCSHSILNTFREFYTSGNDRISIYKHQGDHFTLLGRYATNPNHNKPKNYVYRENEGLIGLGWANGFAFVNGAPNYAGNGKSYIEFMQERCTQGGCTITKQRLKKITMHSRSLYVTRINDSGNPNNPDGLIVFESLDPNKVIISDCKTMLENNEQALLLLLKNMKSLTRKIS